MHFLGNDVVDLCDAGNVASAANPRFAQRVLSLPELRLLSRQRPSSGLLWAFWAAKEAAYKALKKSNPQLPFIHRDFQVSLDRHMPMPGTTGATSGSGRGAVRHGAQRIDVGWQWTPDWIHCVTETANAKHRVRTLQQCQAATDFATIKGASALPEQSAAARTLAVGLLRDCGIADASIVRQKQQNRLSPPRVMQHGKLLSGCDVSLSHDGRFAAAAVCA